MHHQNIPVGEIADAPRNPNVMSTSQYQGLVAAIHLEGFQVPILVRPAEKCGYPLPDGEAYEIIDGHHRVRAVRELMESGQMSGESIAAIVIRADDVQAQRMAVAMARIRGEVNLGVAAEIVADLSKRMSDEDLAAYVGYTEADIADLIDIAIDDDLDDEVDMDEMEPPPENQVRTKPWEIVLTYSDRKEYQRVRRALRKAAGKGNDIEAGVARLIEG